MNNYLTFKTEGDIFTIFNLDEITKLHIVRDYNVASVGDNMRKKVYRPDCMLEISYKNSKPIVISYDTVDEAEQVYFAIFEAITKDSKDSKGCKCK